VGWNTSGSPPKNKPAFFWTWQDFIRAEIPGEFQREARGVGYPGFDNLVYGVKNIDPPFNVGNPMHAQVPHTQPQLHNGTVWDCPASINNEKTNQWMDYDTWQQFQRGPNERTGGLPNYGPWSDQPHDIVRIYQGGRYGAARLHTKIPDPSNRFLWSGSGTDDNPNRLVARFSRGIDRHGGHWKDKIAAPWPATPHGFNLTRRHSNGLNSLYLDGHAKTLNNSESPNSDFYGFQNLNPTVFWDPAKK